MKKTLLGITCFFVYILSIHSQTLYGTTFNGGNDDVGTINKFITATDNFTVSKSFESIASTGGQNPSAGLMQTSDGKLYGMTNQGGSSGYGVIFSFDPLSSIYVKLKDFDYTDGAYPYGSLVKARDGKLYGMTNQGGSNGYGVIFSFDPSSSTYTKLKDFDSIGGAYPYGSLVQAMNGKLYGMTNMGGTSDSGVIFSFDPSSATYTKLKDFDHASGDNPLGSLMQASDGKLYGMTYDGGNGYQYLGSVYPVGVIFSIDPSTSAYLKLIDFDYGNGTHPYGNLIQARDGKLYGMTYGGGNGGTVGAGVIFSLDPSSGTYTKLREFDFITRDGANPFGSLMQASDGNLYGMTSRRQDVGYGVIFSIDPSSLTYSKLQDFDGTNGANPYFGSAFIEMPEAGSLPVSLISFVGKNNRNGNQLSWKVENEQNLDHYELQRSVDGQNFKMISQIKAAGNNSYTYNDPVATGVSSLYYYRLKSVDRDGNFKYSIVIRIRTNINGFVIVNPNPFKNKLVVRVESLIQDKATFILTDVSGRQLYKANKLLSPGINVVEISETDRLSKGTYLLTIIESQQTQSIKVIKGN